MNKELQLKSTITDITEHYDKNNHRFYKVWITWELGKSRIFYAFANDFNLKDDTLRLLTNSPEKLINQRVTITYQELEQKDKQGTFCRIKEIEI